MRRERGIRMRGLGWACLLLASLAAKAAPPLELKSDDPTAGDQIETYVKALVDEFRKAATEKDVLDARIALGNGYRYCIGRGHGYTFAQKAVLHVTPLLAGQLDANDPLLHLKETNLALFFSQFKDVPVQPALDRMAVHSNPGVRLLAWKGYQGLRPALLAQGMAQANQMFATLQAAAAAKEDSWPVITAMLGAATLPPVADAAVEAPVWQFAQQETIKAIEANWKRFCKGVRNGSPEASNACVPGVQALKNLSLIDPNNAEKTKAILQMLIDVTWCSGQAFADDKTLGTVAQANNLLLRECEGSLNEATRQTKNLIGGALQASGAAAGPAVRGAVLDWSDWLRKQYQTETPKDSRFEPAGTQPTTAPATGNPT